MYFNYAISIPSFIDYGLILKTTGRVKKKMKKPLECCLQLLF